MSDTVVFDENNWLSKNPKQKKSFARTKVTQLLRRNLCMSDDKAGENADALIYENVLDLVQLMTDHTYLMY